MEKGQFVTEVSRGGLVMPHLPTFELISVMAPCVKKFGSLLCCSATLSAVITSVNLCLDTGAADACVPRIRNVSLRGLHNLFKENDVEKRKMQIKRARWNVIKRFPDVLDVCFSPWWSTKWVHWNAGRWLLIMSFFSHINTIFVIFWVAICSFQCKFYAVRRTTQPISSYTRDGYFAVRFLVLKQSISEWRSQNWGVSMTELDVSWNAKNCQLEPQSSVHFKFK